jgi:undecaprenyl diphosphate synthase
MVRSSLHIAIIMDGNGRWAIRRALPRAAGHEAGAAALRRAVEAAPSLGISTLSVYAFSSDNWKRPAEEIEFLMALLAWHLESETPRCIESGVRVEIIGRRDRLPDALCRAMERAERATSHGTRLTLKIAIDYSARDSILCAAQRLPAQAPSRAVFEQALNAAPPVDLLIRTGGEQRLSDFLLWECAYAELFFTPVMWPDFDAGHLARALREFARRERRFGGVPVEPPPETVSQPRWLR